MTQRARRRHRRSTKKRSKILLGLGVVAAMIAIPVLSVGIWALDVAAEAPPIDELKPIDKGENSQIFAADGTRLGFIRSDESRTPIPLADIPETMQEATVAIEDERFYEHSGVDPNAIFRALIENIEAGETVQGGSTITQQLVRNLYIADPQRDLERKIVEAKLAEELEQEHTKEWILEQYLNTASYGTLEGRSAIGVEAAAQTYFSKSAKELSLDEAALLAGLPQSPSAYNPFLDPNAALARRNDVLDAMLDQGYVTQAEHDKAIDEGLGLDRGYKYTRIKEPYFFDYVEQELIDRYGVNTVRQGGLKVYTSIRPDLQRAARQAIYSHGYASDPTAAVASIDVATGHIVAMASSRSYNESNFNLAAQGHRQAGSSFKAYVLATALRQGIDPYSTTYTSRHLDLNLPEYGNWVVDTAEGSECNCALTIADATRESDNTVFAQLDLDVGPENVADTAHDMGIESPLDGLPAEGIGGLRIGVTPLEMADAYSTLARGGVHREASAIVKVDFPNGDVDVPGENKEERVFSDGVAYTETDILKTVISGGTGTAANIGCPAAGKTGTTDSFTDAWFVGYTPKLATAVWVGHPDARSTLGYNAFGGTLAAPIWHDYMEVAKGDYCGDFPEPTDPIDYQPFYGNYANGGGDVQDDYSSGSSSSYDTTTTTPTTGDTGGYDPQYYAPGAGQQPAPSPDDDGN
ncbi:MAG TPA: transglycosylase domain-containing protein [Solirubrobacterales bacterium]|nr:transglycosylase domain-containing protein [Solirubrobacterales bacterium]